MRHYNHFRAQAGMTLIELTVVLLVLIGLAGLLIPYVSGFVGKTHDATGSSNMAQVGNAIVRFETEKGRLPDLFDSMLVGAGTTTATAIPYTIAGKMAVANGGAAGTDDVAAMSGKYAATPIDISAAGNAQVCGALNKAGIDRVVNMDNGTKSGFSATFNNADGTAAIATIGNPMMNTCTGSVLEIANTKVATAFGLPTSATANKRYVLFGLGGQSEMIGKTIQDTPVHFAKDAQYNASQAYNRFGVILEVDNDSTQLNTYADSIPARYVGTVMLMGDVTGLQAELSNYYKTAAATN